MRTLTFLTIIFCLVISSYALSTSPGAGTVAFPFLLETDTGAKASAVAGAWVGWAKSADCFTYNPAATTLRRKQSVVASFGNFWGLLNSGFVGYTNRLNDNEAFSLGFHLVSYGEFIQTDEMGEITGEFTGNDFAVIGSYARKMFANLSAGLNTRLLYSAIDTFTQSAISFDVGIMYNDKRDDFRAGLVFSNLGLLISKYGDDSAPLPWAVKLGGYYDLPGFPGEIGAQIETSADVDIRARVGLELDFLKPFYLRFGYLLKPKPENDPSNSEQLDGLTAGAGIHYKNITFNYSVQNYGVLGFVHRAEIGYIAF
ncbi:hypothetical protein DRQ33_06060 [bacterium]|nr:MAG: hypothetical protein DRQ33_06060 [bacterium]